MRRTLAAGALLAVLSGCHRITDKAGLAGEFRHTWGYQTLTSAGFWLGLLCIGVGAAWAARGEFVWGFFLVFVGLIVTPMMFLAAWRFWVCC